MERILSVYPMDDRPHYYRENDPGTNNYAALRVEVRPDKMG